MRKRHQPRVGTLWSYTGKVGSRRGWMAASSPLQGVPSASRLPLQVKGLRSRVGSAEASYDAVLVDPQIGADLRRRVFLL